MKTIIIIVDWLLEYELGSNLEKGPITMELIVNHQSKANHYWFIKFKDQIPINVSKLNWINYTGSQPIKPQSTTVRTNRKKN